MIFFKDFIVFFNPAGGRSVRLCSFIYFIFSSMFPAQNKVLKTIKLTVETPDES